MQIHSLSMVRNDADIIGLMLRQTEELFDKHFIIDVQSSDGTHEKLTQFCQNNPKFELFSIELQEKYQSAMMNRMARRAFEAGADWVFLLDADEYLNVGSRSELIELLEGFGKPILGLPWMNLVPTQYGTFERFDAAQDYHWNGRVSAFKKIALSKELLGLYPDFYIAEGNHDVYPSTGGRPLPAPIGGTILHLPIRSLSRLRNRLASVARVLQTKHNTLKGEGSHVGAILKRLDEAETGPEALNAIAAHYGSTDLQESIFPAELGWPMIRLPEYLQSIQHDDDLARTIGEMVEIDQSLKWLSPKFVKGSIVRADIEDGIVKIVPQPIKGTGDLVYSKFDALPNGTEHLPNAANLDLLTGAVAASFTKIDHWTFSAWSELVPTLFALMSVARPRRYVELGVHNGMSFFGACQIAESLGLKTECVAIDSWVGDAHASFHTETVFNDFRAVLSKSYPNQSYIRGFFSEARASFNDGSIDLLHIDGFHSYEAVKEDFETWLPKMSETGIVIFHDINVHQRGFGVWRYWEELKATYPTISLYHCHGLGILYAGKSPGVLRDLFDLIGSNKSYQVLLQQYLEGLGELAVNNRRLLAEQQGGVSHQQASTSGGLNLTETDFAPNQQQLLLEWQEGVRSKADAKRRKYKGLLRGILRSRAKRKTIATRKSNSALIRSSNLFDEQYYLNRYEDVRESGVDPIMHYLECGALELRDPSPQFSTSGYLLHNDDVRASQVNPLLHFVKFGRSEGRAC